MSEEVKKDGEFAAQGAPGGQEVSLQTIAEKLDKLISMLGEGNQGDFAASATQMKSEEDKKKEGSGENVKIPKATAGETDETCKPEGNKSEDFVAKMEKKIEHKFEDLIKGMQKTSTPRTQHEDVKKSVQDESDPGMDIIKAAKAGKSIASINVDNKDKAQREYDAKVAALLAGRK